MSDEELLSAPKEPLELFDRWFSRAKDSEASNPEAMTLATVNVLANPPVPEVRTVLLKKIDQDGLVFFTNSLSTKGQNMAANPEVALLFYWRSLDRQIRVNGRVIPIAEDESDSYYASRSRISRIGAWASQQSQPMENFDTLKCAVAEMEARFPNEIVPRPPHWFGYRVTPRRFEFWVQEKGRLHQRIEYTRGSATENWAVQWLYP